jgi:hypothetical protein
MFFLLLLVGVFGFFLGLLFSIYVYWVVLQRQAFPSYTEKELQQENLIWAHLLQEKEKNGSSVFN